MNWRRKEMLGYSVRDARYVVAFRMYKNENYRRVRSREGLRDLVIRQRDLGSMQVYFSDSAKSVEQAFGITWKCSPILTYPNPNGAILGRRVANKREMQRIIARIPNNVDPSSIQVYMMSDAMWPEEIFGESLWKEVLTEHANWHTAEW